MSLIARHCIESPVNITNKIPKIFIFRMFLPKWWLFFVSTGLQQHLLHNGVAEPGPLPIPVLTEDVPGYIQLCAGVPAAQRYFRLHGSTQYHYRRTVHGKQFF